MNAFRNPLNLALVAILILATAAGFLLVPEAKQLPVHWGLDGHVDSTLPRNLALIQMPIATAAVWAIVAVISRFGNSGRGAGAAAGLRIILPGVTVLFLLIQLVIVLLGAGVPLPFFQSH
jgi:hypothetical protein